MWLGSLIFLEDPNSSGTLGAIEPWGSEWLPPDEATASRPIVADPFVTSWRSAILGICPRSDRDYDLHVDLKNAAGGLAQEEGDS